MVAEQAYKKEVNIFDCSMVVSRQYAFVRKCIFHIFKFLKKKKKKLSRIEDIRKIISENCLAPKYGLKAFQEC